MFDTRPQFHEYPDVEGFPAYDCEIVSSEMPSGASWLANCLLELGVAVWKPWGADLREDWTPAGERRFRYSRGDETWRRLLPSLRHAREFTFRDAPVPRLTHAWPGTYADPPRTILFVRDPRDALYSLWHRAQRVGMIAADQPFAEFIAAPWFHYPTSRAEYLMVWMRVWRLALSDREHLVVRYEDYRADPQATLRRALAFLRMDVDAASLERAVAASDFQVARTAEQELIDTGMLTAQFNRAGHAEEWRQSFDASMHAAMGARFSSLYDWLGYAEDLSGQAPGVPTSPAAEWIAAMLAATQAQQWPTQRGMRLRDWLVDASLDRA